jgi:two-component system sensor histidine kinase KdpD
LRRAGKVLANHSGQMRRESDLPLLELDDVLWEQALFNLLDNAAKYTPPGSHVSVSAWREGGQVRLQVMDEGPGIPPADLERIFDKFYRSGGTDHRRAGTGLGLSICRGFIEAMGGTITAANRADRSGAVFTVAFPVPVNVDRQLESMG